MKGLIIIILSSFIPFLFACGQKEEPLVIFKCDTTKGNDLVWFYSKYPPILKIKIPDLEKILNNGLEFPAQENDSIMKIYITAIIKCDSSAVYRVPDSSQCKRKRYPGLEQKIIEILQANCTWSPGKESIEWTKTISKRVNGKIVHLKQYTHHLVWFGITFSFGIQNGKIKLLNKINSIQ